MTKATQKKIDRAITKLREAVTLLSDAYADDPSNSNLRVAAFGIVDEMQPLAGISEIKVPYRKIGSGIQWPA